MKVTDTTLESPSPAEPLLELPSPQDRDIVVAEDPGAVLTWAIKRYLGPAALGAESRDQAVRLAGVLGKEMAVDVWSLEAGRYELIATGRRSRASRRRS